jgi:DnaJ-class molecular chaperone
MPRKTEKVNTSDSPSNAPPVMPFGDINKLMQSAQQLAQSMSSEDKSKLDSMDMSQMFEHVSSSLFSTMEKGGNVIDPASKEQMKVLSKTMLDQVMVNSNNTNDSNFISKINFDDAPEINTKQSQLKDPKDKVPTNDNNFEMLLSDDEADSIKPIVEDLYYKLQISLEEAYAGKTKKLAVTRDRISGKSIIKEKRKLEIPITPGVKNGQEVRFNKEGNEKLGYQSGDIVVTIVINNHDIFERVGNNLFTVKNIGLYESYSAKTGDVKIILKHLDGSNIVLKSDGHPLHTKDGTRKIRGGGLPIIDKNSDKPKYGDLYIRFNLILPENFEGDKGFDIIEKLFPVIPENKENMIYKNSLSSSVDKSNIREVLLEEVTPEDMEQLDFDDESSSDDSSSEESGSD